jgi:hypothetical protein
MATVIKRTVSRDSLYLVSPSTFAAWFLLEYAFELAARLDATHCEESSKSEHLGEFEVLFKNVYS